MTYIFLTPELGTMGGSQMYVCNKSTYLRSKGWNVKIVYFTESELLIKRLNEFERHLVPELAWGIQFYMPRRVEKIIHNLVVRLSTDDKDVIIESCLFHLSLWGEMLAKEMKAKHILHFLEEDIPSFSNRIAAFMEFKLFRWECMNASEKSLMRLFKVHYKSDYKQYEFKTDFFCSNVSQDEDSQNENEIELREADDTILSIGRLDKPYIQEMVNQVLAYANKYSNRKINIILIGGSPDGTEEGKIEKRFLGTPNIQVYLLGYLFPVPTNIVKLADVSIATSNSVLISYNVGIPTIAVDANDFYAIGLYGVDTKLKVFRKDEKQVPICDYLERVLIMKDYKENRITDIGKSEIELLDEHFKSQTEFIIRTENDGCYYPVKGLYTLPDYLRGLLVRVYTSLK